MDDLAVNALKMQHTSDYLRDGTTQRMTVYTFYLGKHGPLVLRYPIDAPQPFTVNADIERLRGELRGLVG